MYVSSISSFTKNINQSKKSDLKIKDSCYYPSFKAEIPIDIYRNYLKVLVKNNELKTIQLSKNYINGLQAFRKLGNFTIDEYKGLTEYEVNCINEVAYEHIYNNKRYALYNENFNKNLHYHDIVAKGIKDKLNSMFGEGNYYVIPIGRSLSSIGKCLGYKIGEDKVKELPLSRANRFLDLEKSKDINFDALSKYLNSIGLSKKDIETSEKQYVFMDYCASGWSFLGAKNLLKADKIFGNSLNIKFFNILHLLKTVKLDKPTHEFFPEIDTFIEDLSRMFKYSQFKKYALVNECIYFDKIKDSIKQPEDFSFESRIFLFKLLDNEMKNIKKY